MSALSYAFAAGGVQAQQTDSEQIEGIVVTALKRETTLQETPLSIAVLSGEDISRLGASGIADYIRAVPGLQLTEGATGQRRITIRGINGSGEATVGLYYDETPVTGPTTAGTDPSLNSPDLNLFDVTRVEVLRGPQGTLYGSSSMGGTVRILFNKPDSTKMEGAFDGQVSSIKGGSTGFWTKGMINVPVIENLMAVRAVLYKENRPGYVDNVRLGMSDINKTKNWGGRFMLGLTPSEDISVNATYIHQDQTFEDGATWYPEAGQYKSNGYARLYFPNKLDLVNATLKWDMGFASLTGTSSYYKWDVTRNLDTTRSGLIFAQNGNYCSLYFGQSAACSTSQREAYANYANALLPAINRQPSDMTVWVHELRLSGSTGPVEWTVGGFLEDRKDSSDSAVVRVDAATGDAMTPLVYLGQRLIATTLNQKAAFGEGTWNALPGLSLTAGLRYYKYEKTTKTHVTQTNYLNGSVAGPEANFNSDASGTIAKFNISYEPQKGLMLYAQASQGMRPGGANNVPGLPAELVAYQADKLWSYEAGVKTALAGGRVTFDVATYMIDWSDMQTTARTANGAFQFITNIGSARIKGIEMSSTVRPMRGLNLTLAANYLTAKLKEDQINDLASAAGRKGDRIPFEPEVTVSGSADYNWAIGTDLSGLLHVDGNYVGSSYSEFRPTNTYQEKQGNYATFNFRGGIERGRTGIYLFVQNMFDSAGKLRVTSSLGTEQATISVTPRTVGVNLRTAF